MVTSADLPEELQVCCPQVIEFAADAPALPFRAAKARFEYAYVLDLLKRFDHKISRAAKAAGVDRKTFYSLLKKHHLN